MREIFPAYGLEDPEVGHVDGTQTHSLDAVKVDDATDARLAHPSNLTGDLVENVQVFVVRVLVRKSRGIDEGESLRPILCFIMLARSGGCDRCGDVISDKYTFEWRADFICRKIREFR